MADERADWGGERRKKVIVNKKIQLRYIGLLSASFLLILVLVEWHIYSLVKSMMPKVALAQDYNYITSLGLTIMIEMLVIIFIVGMINIVYTHRLVGPVVSRMEQELGGMLKKNEFQHLKLRQKDELKPLVDEINKLIDRARK